jgi:uncharacterized protein YcbK (DUF882 family)
VLHATRRRFLGLAAGSLFVSGRAQSHTGERTLALVSLHTGESIRRPYWAEGRYLTEMLAEFALVLRDHRNGEIKPIDPRLLDQLHDLRETLGMTQPFRVISGYRSPASNARLHERSSGVASNSLHLQGRAIDVSAPGVALEKLRGAGRTA